jgi:hypothetical protein
MSVDMAVSPFAQDDECSAAQAAPMLPVEGYAVTTTRALEAAKSHAEQALLLLQWLPRDSDTSGAPVIRGRGCAHSAACSEPDAACPWGGPGGG